MEWYAEIPEQETSKQIEEKKKTEVPLVQNLVGTGGRL